MPSVSLPDRPGPRITVRTGSGSGRTRLSAFDHALTEAGVADLNLVTLSSVIPPRSTVVRGHEPLGASHGDRLWCVLSTAYADQLGENAWAGLGWVVADDGRGLFVEHHSGSEDGLLEQISLSLDDMVRTRGGGYGPHRTAVASAHCTAGPVCAVVVAAYEVQGWVPGA